MSSDQLNLFSYEILGLIGSGGAGPHELRQMVRRGRAFDWAGESRYYVEPKRLARLGYLESRSEPGRTRPRTVYSLTAKGRDALTSWAATPVRFDPLKSEAMIRLLLADLVGEAVTREAIATLREDLADVRDRIAVMVAGAEALPHRRKYLLLNIRLLELMIAAHEEWIDEVEAALS